MTLAVPVLAALLAGLAIGATAAFLTSGRRGRARRCLKCDCGHGQRSHSPGGGDCLSWVTTESDAIRYSSPYPNMVTQVRCGCARYSGPEVTARPAQRDG